MGKEGIGETVGQKETYGEKKKRKENLFVKAISGRERESETVRKLLKEGHIREKEINIYVNKKIVEC